MPQYKHIGEVRYVSVEAARRAAEEEEPPAEEPPPADEPMSPPLSPVRGDESPPHLAAKLLAQEAGGDP